MMETNARDLELELTWFLKVLDARFKLYFGADTASESITENTLDLTPPDLGSSDSSYASFLQHYRLSFLERMAVVLSLVPHLRPHLLDIFFTKNKTFDRRFTEFGGIYGPRGDFIPTGETLAFIGYGTAIQGRFAVQSLFGDNHFFTKHSILRLSPAPFGDEPLLAAALRLSDEYVARLTTGRTCRLEFGADFPARRIETQLTPQRSRTQRGRARAPRAPHRERASASAASRRRAALGAAHE